MTFDLKKFTSTDPMETFVTVRPTLNKYLDIAASSVALRRPFC